MNMDKFLQENVITIILSRNKNYIKEYKLIILVLQLIEIKRDLNEKVENRKKKVKQINRYRKTMNVYK